MKGRVVLQICLMLVTKDTFVVNSTTKLSEALFTATF
jgi:hypothetical protein